MELLSTITAILVIADKAIELAQQLKFKSDKDLSQLLKDMGKLLDEVHEELVAGNYPHQKCGQLHLYLENFKYVAVKHKLRLADQLDSVLTEAYQVERMFGQLSTCTEEEKKINLSKLEEAAGMFIAAGVLMYYE